MISTSKTDRNENGDKVFSFTVEKMDPTPYLNDKEELGPEDDQ